MPCARCTWPCTRCSSSCSPSVSCAGSSAGGSPACIDVVIVATVAFGALRLYQEAWAKALVLAWVALLFVAQDFAWLACALYVVVRHSARRAIATALVAVVFVASVLALNLGGQSR